MNSKSLLLLSVIIAFYIFKQSPKEGFGTNYEYTYKSTPTLDVTMQPREPIIGQLEVPSTRQDTVIRGDPRDGKGRKDKLVLSDRFEEVKQIYGHGYAPQDYKMAAIDTDPPIYLPSKRLIDAHGGNYFLPEMPCPDSRFVNDPTPLDKENLFSRNKSHAFHVEKVVHPLRHDVKFLVTDN